MPHDELLNRSSTSEAISFVGFRVLKGLTVEVEGDFDGETAEGAVDGEALVPLSEVS